MSTIAVLVERIHRETEEVRLFDLVSADGSRLPPFSPGAHIDVHLGGHLVRQYSLCNGPEDTDRYTIGVKREPRSRGGSLALHERTGEGDVLQVGVPRNHFELRHAEGPCVLIAAGIGITPILSMARHLQARGAPFRLHYFSRSKALTAFHGLLSSPAFAPQVDFHVAMETDAVNATLRELLRSRETGAHLYLCGPRPFMDAVRAVARATWPTDAVHAEYFTGDGGAMAAPRHRFVVRLARSGREYAVDADQSVVQVLQRHGVPVCTSCEQGVCGTCLTVVLAGEPDHRDAFLTEEERRAGDRFMPCVSRSRSEVLVLDL